MGDKPVDKMHDLLIFGISFLTVFNVIYDFPSFSIGLVQGFRNHTEARFTPKSKTALSDCHNCHSIGEDELTLLKTLTVKL